MGLIADIFLLAGALGATFYCFILSRRLSKFNDLEKGVGGAVAILSAQVDDMTKTLEKAQVAAQSSTMSLDGLTDRAEGVAQRLELLVASMHDLPEAAAPVEEIKTPKPESNPDTTPPAGESALMFMRHRTDEAS
ncbi:hypothetical protein [Cochlodiniinecator piscidefendens]|uniref:hypothetical protein n=1 Tax=Cochlodiniinecator piscidefendens TaxID=2715756 RepID=UPI00140A6E77|nr:hypothetical protein [Cochlodiniinecator piscidefendens]